MADSLLDGDSPLRTDITGSLGSGWWAGLSADRLKGFYKKIYELGTLSKANYIVQMSLIDQSDRSLAKLPIFSRGPATDQNRAWSVPWLATSVSSGLLDAQTDSVNIGHFQQNFITGNGSNEVQVTFLETQNGDFLKAVKEIKNVMFHPDGTQGLPYEYLLEMTVSLFKRNDRSDRPVIFNWIVALSAAQLDLESSDRDPLTVPLTFVKMYPMMEKSRA